LATLDLQSPDSTLDKTNEVIMSVQVMNDMPFTLGTELRYSFSHHKGWESAEEHTTTLDPKRKAQTFSAKCQVPDRSVILALYAGADIHYGKFSRTLCAHQYLYRGNWADPIRVK